jgi:HEPN domain-containing protein
LSAQEDWEAYLALRRAKRYAQALFFLHLTIEKLLKAIIVKSSGQHAPMTHSLAYLLGKTSLECPERYLDQLSEMSKFNMASRYPDEKLLFYKSIDRSASLHWHKIGVEIKQWLENSLSEN